ncbi:hypothetical protein HG530_002670 [Fusarium avenaceum]|nr:hypothetical protein HG530_002670 [Fusarium avenaceum]
MLFSSTDSVNKFDQVVMSGSPCSRFIDKERECKTGKSIAEPNGTNLSNWFAEASSSALQLVFPDVQLSDRKRSKAIERQRFEAVFAQVKNAKTRHVLNLVRERRDVVTMHVKYFQLIQTCENGIERTVEEVVCKFQVA